MKFSRMLALAMVLVMSTVALTSCKKEGEAEKLGKKLDEGAEKASDKMEKFKERAKEAIEKGETK